MNVHTYCLTLRETCIVTKELQLLAMSPLGTEIDTATAPVGCVVAPAMPETVVVRVVVPPRVGLADACRVMIGVCSATVAMTGPAVTRL